MRPERPHEPRRHADVLGDRVAVLVEELRQPVDAVDADRPDPRQVVQPDVIELDPLGLDAEPRGEPALEADRDVAQADRPVALVEQRLADDPDRVREVDDPVARRREPVRLLGDVEDDRHGPERLREAAGPGRLLADRAEPRGERLVDEAGRLAADAKLDDDEVGAVEGRLEDAADLEPAGPTETRQLAPGHAADDLGSIGVDVEQDEVVDPDAVVADREALDELRRVRAPAADDRDLQNALPPPRPVARGHLTARPGPSILLITLSSTEPPTRGPPSGTWPVSGSFARSVPFPSTTRSTSTSRPRWTPVSGRRATACRRSGSSPNATAAA